MDNTQEPFYEMTIEEKTPNPEWKPDLRRSAYIDEMPTQFRSRILSVRLTKSQYEDIIKSVIERW